MQCTQVTCKHSIQMYFSFQAARCSQGAVEIAGSQSVQANTSEEAERVHNCSYSADTSSMSGIVSQSLSHPHTFQKQKPHTQKRILGNGEAMSLFFTEFHKRQYSSDKKNNNNTVCESPNKVLYKKAVQSVFFYFLYRTVVSSVARQIVPIHLCYSMPRYTVVYQCPKNLLNWVYAESFALKKSKMYLLYRDRAVLISGNF